jgi:hypothetical protein
MTGRDGFLQILRAEWTKLRSVRRWSLTLLIGFVLTVGLGLMAAAGTRSDANTQNPRPFQVSFDNRAVVDNFGFAHRPLSGDGTLTAHLASQTDSHEWAGAGLVVKESLEPGTRYAALVVTPRHGLRLRANFATDTPVGGGGPRWLRLIRSGSTVTGYESADGATWRAVGTVNLAALPPTVQVGLVVYSPERSEIERQGGTTYSGSVSTNGLATFDNVRLDGSSTGDWTGDNVGTAFTKKDVPGVPSNLTRSGDRFTLVGSGDVGPAPPADDPVQTALFGVVIGVIAFIALGVLYVTSEYKAGMIRTTLAVSRGRGRVLAAKAVLLGLATLAIGLAATATTFLLTQPMLRRHGYAPPAFDYVSLVDGPVLRAVVGSAGFMALMAIVGLGLGTVLRHGAAAITAGVVLVVLPVFAAVPLPTAAATWLMYLTPTGGLAIQRALPPTPTLAEPWSWISPWTGFATVCAYAAAALAGAYVLLRRRDA